MAKEENIHVSAEDVLNAISMALNPATSTSTPSSAAGVARPMERPSSSGMNIEDTLTDDFLATLRLDAFAPRNVRLTRMFVILDDDFKTMKVPVGNKRKQINKADRQKAVTFWRNFTALQLNRKYESFWLIKTLGAWTENQVCNVYFCQFYQVKRLFRIVCIVLYWDILIQDS